MSWAALTTNDVKTRLSGAELSLVQSQVLAQGQSDPMPEIIAQVTGAIRGHIAVKYALGADGTLPPEIKDAAIAIVRWRLIGRLAAGTQGALSGSEHRKNEHDDAWKTVEKIAEGKFAIEKAAPESSEELASGGGEYGSEEKLNF